MIELLEVGNTSLNLDLLRFEELNLGRTFRYKRTGKKEAFALCPLALSVMGKSICPVAEPLLGLCLNLLLQDSNHVRETGSSLGPPEIPGSDWDG